MEKKKKKDFTVTLLNTLAPGMISSPLRRPPLADSVSGSAGGDFKSGMKKKRRENGKKKEWRASLGLSCGAPAANYMQASEEDEVLLHFNTLAGHFSLWLCVGDVDNEPPASLELQQYFTPSPAAPGKKTPSVAPHRHETFLDIFYLKMHIRPPPSFFLSFFL